MDSTYGILDAFAFVVSEVENVEPYGPIEVRTSEHSSGAKQMNQRTTSTLIIAVAACLGAQSAHAGPCTKDIARFEKAVRQSAGDPDAGPYARQSIGAQLNHEPTRASIARAQ